MSLGNVVGVFVVLTSSEELPQVPTEPLETGAQLLPWDTCIREPQRVFSPAGGIAPH